MIIWTDGVPFNEFGEQLYAWPDCDTGAIIVDSGGVPLLCPTHPCEPTVTVACCPNPVPESLMLIWTGAESSGGSEGGGSASMAWVAADECWLCTVTVGGSGASPSDIRLVCDSDWKLRSWGSSPTSAGTPPGAEVTLTEDACDPLALSFASSFSLSTGWSLTGVSIAA